LGTGRRRIVSSQVNLVKGWPLTPGKSGPTPKKGYLPKTTPGVTFEMTGGERGEKGDCIYLG